MIDVRIVQKPAFAVTGVKAFITGQDNDQFAAFWDRAHRDGTVARLRAASTDPAANRTGSRVMGVSRVERDPMNRAFDFYIASECPPLPGMESFTIPACQWAIFTNTGDALPRALVEAEMFAFMEWLPLAEYAHAFAPELEVYPAFDPRAVAFWLPVVRA